MDVAAMTVIKIDIITTLFKIFLSILKGYWVSVILRL